MLTWGLYLRAIIKDASDRNNQRLQLYDGSTVNVDPPAAVEILARKECIKAAVRTGLDAMAAQGCNVALVARLSMNWKMPLLQDLNWS